MRTLGFAVALFCFAGAAADVRLPAVLSDGMVLQHSSVVKVWGWAAPRESVEVASSWGASAKTAADAGGLWAVSLRTPGPGGPHSLSVRGVNSIELRDVLCGEVWVCSGQSNMEWSLAASANPEEQITSANWPQIRIFHVARNQSSTPLADCSGKWAAVGPQTIASFSAVAYSFGRHLHTSLGVPIGLIASAWGGTEAELWTSETTLRAYPDFRTTIDDTPRRNRAFAESFTEWQAKLRLVDAPWDPYTAAQVPAKDWTPITNSGTWQGTPLAGFDGIVWIRATFEVPLDAVFDAATLSLGRIDDADITFVNGVEVGESGSFDIDRAYVLPSGLLRTGENTVAIRVLDTGGDGGVRIGDTSVKLGQRLAVLKNFAYRVAASLTSVPPRPQSTAKRYSVLYNAMIAPLKNYRVRGAIWYQGESNVGRAHQYRQLFPAMIKDWRRAWGYELPFYFVQIAPFAYGGDPAAAAELRDAQLAALSLSSTGMVVTTDLVDNIRDIHPKNKQDVGVRLALIALAQLYGRNVQFSGPLYRDYKVAGSTIRITFSHADGLTSNGAPSHFEIAGNDRKFVAAQARIDGQTVVVSSPEVAAPVAVRFGWSSTAQPNLKNGAGLPASPFRTDAWPGVTDGARW